MNSCPVWDARMNMLPTARLSLCLYQTSPRANVSNNGTSSKYLYSSSPLPKYGPGQSLRNPYTGIISIFSNQMRQNIPIDIYEDGQETRDFIFVQDVADICARALSLECETLLLNVGSGMATPVIDLAQKLKHLWQSNSDIQITGNFRVGDIRHNWADLTALHQVFPDWQPTSLAAGLESFVTWAKTQEIYEDRSKAATQELKQRNL
jgi:dTDP-L-rhamnose 4-epimerase